MFDIIILSHGTLSKALLDTAQLIAGEQKNIITFGFNLGDDIETFQEKVISTIEKELKESDLLVFTDLQSGSPFNVAVGASTKYKFRHFTGINLPILLQAICDRNCMSLDETCIDIENNAKNSIIDVDKILNTVEGADDEDE